MEFTSRTFLVYIPGLYMIPIGLNMIFVSTNRIIIIELPQPLEIIIVILWAMLIIWGFYFSLKKRVFTFNNDHLSLNNKPLTDIKKITISKKTTYLYVELQNGIKRNIQFRKEDREAIERTAFEWCELHGCEFTYK